MLGEVGNQNLQNIAEIDRTIARLLELGANLVSPKGLDILAIVEAQARVIRELSIAREHLVLSEVARA